jgi:hypothetical protein
MLCVVGAILSIEAFETGREVEAPDNRRILILGWRSLSNPSACPKTPAAALDLYGFDACDRFDGAWLRPDPRDAK